MQAIDHKYSMTLLFFKLNRNRSYVDQKMTFPLFNSQMKEQVIRLRHRNAELQMKLENVNICYMHVTIVVTMQFASRSSYNFPNLLGQDTSDPPSPYGHCYRYCYHH